MVFHSGLLSYIPTSNAKGPSFSACIPTLGIFCLFCFVLFYTSHPDGCDHHPNFEFMILLLFLIVLLYICTSKNTLIFSSFKTLFQEINYSPSIC